MHVNCQYYSNIRIVFSHYLVLCIPIIIKKKLLRRQSFLIEHHFCIHPRYSFASSNLQKTTYAYYVLSSSPFRLQYWLTCNRLNTFPPFSSIHFIRYSGISGVSLVHVEVGVEVASGGIGLQNCKKLIYIGGN